MEEFLSENGRAARQSAEEVRPVAAKARFGRRDLTGQRFGKLVCLEPTQARGADGKVVWRCRCDCGGECLAVSSQLTHGYKKSCGCMRRPPLKEYVGRRFGALVVTGYAGKENGAHFWRCRCDCGREAAVRQSNLQSGHARSCGCLQREIGQENLKIVEGTSVTIIRNRMKRRIRSNTSGYNGVYKHKRTGKWAAQITFQGKTYYLGEYADIQDAVKARKRGEEMYENFLEWYDRTYLAGRKKGLAPGDSKRKRSDGEPEKRGAYGREKLNRQTEGRKRPEPEKSASGKNIPEKNMPEKNAPGKGMRASL